MAGENRSKVTLQSAGASRSKQEQATAESRRRDCALSGFRQRGSNAERAFHLTHGLVR